MISLAVVFSVLALAIVGAIAGFIWLCGGPGVLIVLGIFAGIGAAWGWLDERRHQRQYEEDMKCSQ